jgi:hypothetical protein
MGNFVLREEYQLMHGRAYKDYRVGIEKANKKRCGFEEEARWLPVVMHFESRFASGPDNICDIFADFIQRTYADDVWVPSDPGADLVQNDPPFRALHFTVDEVQIVLLELDVNKAAGSDGKPPLILNN